MIRRSIATLALMALCPAGPLLACGDKLFLVGFNQRFSDVYAAVRRGSIVIYTPGPLPKKDQHLRNPRLHKVLKRAGHDVKLALTPVQLADALATGTVDIVLTLESTVPAIEQPIKSASSKPALVAVALAATGKLPPDRSSNRDGATTQAVGGAKGTHVYTVIEDVMKARAEAGLWRAQP